MQSNELALADARRDFMEGRIEQAEEVCRHLLLENPLDAEMLHLAGLIAHHRNRMDAAIDLFERAAAAGHDRPQFHYNLGVVYQTCGRIDDAVAEYRRALELDPASAEVLSNLGYALFQLGRLDEAVATLTEAVRIEPRHAEAHNNLGLALAARGEAEQATLNYRRALCLKPDLAEAQFNLGLSLVSLGKVHEAANCFQQAIEIRGEYTQAERRLALLLPQISEGNQALEALEKVSRDAPDDASLADALGNAYTRVHRFEEALECYRQAVRLQPDVAVYHNNLGNGLRLLKRSDDALAAFDRALSLSPNLAEAHVNLGRIRAEREEFDEARSAFDRALEIDADHPGARSELGQLLKKQGRWEEAIEEYQKVLRRKPDDAATHVLLGNAHTELKRYAEAEKFYRAAMLLQPADAVVRSNLGNVLTLLGRPEEAEAECRLALALRGGQAEAYHNRGIALSALGRSDEARAARRHALKIRPDYPEAKLCHSLELLAQENYGEGWAEYEWRWRQKSVSKPAYEEPEWDGSPLAGRTILLYAEQGLGDTLQFVRFAPLVQQCGGRVVLQCQKPLRKLLSLAGGIDQLVVPGDPLVPFEVQLPLMSVPRVLGITAETIPRDVPYLFPDRALVEQWRHELAGSDGFKVGIAWQGNPTFTGDLLRSVPLEHFEPLANVAGVRLFSLQKGFGREQLAQTADRFEVVDLGDRIDVSTGAFMDTAAIIANLDLMITSDSAIAHLCGALGAPTWVALPLGADWRWLEGREDSPWYPTMRLFRKRSIRDWNEVFQRLAAELEREIDRRGARSAAGQPSPRLRRAPRVAPPTRAVSPSKPTENASSSAPVAAPRVSSDGPLVSVVIPCYNGAADLPPCVASVAAQNTNCEIIIVDDGSTDDSLAVATALMRASALPMVVVSQANGGCGPARNTGLRLVQGKYVCFFDVDDQYVPGFFAAALERFQGDPSLVAVRCGVELVNVHRPVEPWHLQIIANTICSNQMVLTEAARRLGGFPYGRAFLGEVGGEDWPFRQQLSKIGKVERIDHCYYRKRVRRGSHFDLLLDRSELRNGRLIFKWQTKEERDGSLIRATVAYEQGIRLREVARVRDDLRSAAGSIEEFHRLQEQLSCSERACQQDVEGFLLYSLARRWHSEGRVVQLGGGGELCCWLAAGCRAAQREKLLLVAAQSDVVEPFPQKADLSEWIEVYREGETAASLPGAAAVRLLFIARRPDCLAPNMLSEWLKCMAPFGLVVVDANSSPDLMQHFDELRQSGVDWEELAPFAGLRLLQFPARSGPLFTEQRAEAEAASGAPLLTGSASNQSSVAESRTKSLVQVNLSCAINNLGYGVVGLNLLKALVNRGASVACWPEGNPEAPPEDAKLVRDALSQRHSKRDAVPSLRVYHQFRLKKHHGSPRVGFPIFELDRFTSKEIDHLRAQDFLLVASQWARRTVEANGVYDHDLVRVVPLGVDRTVFHECPLVNQRKLARETTVFLAVGKWARRKGHDVLLQAFAKAFRPDDDVELWMLSFNPCITSTPGRAAATNDEWESLYRASPLAAKIKLLPRLGSQREVAELMRQADCGVFLSRAEGWNLPALEMLSCGKQIVVTNYSAHTEFCDASNARLIEIDQLEDAYDGGWFSGQGRWAALGEGELEQAIVHFRQVHQAKQEGRLALNQPGIETARRYTWDACAARVLQAIGELVAGTKPQEQSP